MVMQLVHHSRDVSLHAFRNGENELPREYVIYPKLESVCAQCSGYEGLIQTDMGSVTNGVSGVSDRLTGHRLHAVVMRIK